MLQPGETKQLTFHLPVDQLAYYDLDSCLIVEAGRIEVMLGSSSEDIRLRGEFEITGDPKMPVRERVFVCPVTVE
jgi:beta-glucosidase